LNKPVYALFTISSTVQSTEESKIIAKKSSDFKDCRKEVEMISSIFTNRKCKLFYNLCSPDTESDKTLLKSDILENLLKFKKNVYDEKYHHIIIYYTGDAYKSGVLKGDWVCRNGQGISLKDITDLFE
jgi:hypothetical protein